MNRKFTGFIAVLLLVLAATATSYANGFFVATAQNFRGALYQGMGPTPGHASEMAVVKCSQDSFLPCSCKVVSVRMECPPAAMCPPPLRKPLSKTRISQTYPSSGYMGRPMP